MMSQDFSNSYHLYVDSSYDLTIGLLDNQGTWLERSKITDAKTSEVLQVEIFNLLNKHKLNYRKLTSLITSAGPGFYTGLRLTEGLSDLSKIIKIPCFSFYNYEIPRWSGVCEGTWLTKAYKGEYLLYHWNDLDHSSELLGSHELETWLKSEQAFYYPSEKSLDERLKQHVSKGTCVETLFFSNGEVLLHKVIQSQQTRSSYYFRPSEEEYKANP